MVCLSRPYHFKFFKGCLPQILLGPFLNTLTQIILSSLALFIFRKLDHFISWFGIQRQIQDCCNIQDGALCDNSQWLKAVNYYYKVLHLGCCSSIRSASGITFILWILVLLPNVIFINIIAFFQSWFFSLYIYLVSAEGIQIARMSLRVYLEPHKFSVS